MYLQTNSFTIKRGLGMNIIAASAAIYTKQKQLLSVDALNMASLTRYIRTAVGHTVVRAPMISGSVLHTAARAQMKPEPNAPC